jgi:hypothetical protein
VPLGFAWEVQVDERFPGIWKWQCKESGHRGPLCSETVVCPLSVAIGKCWREFGDMKAGRWEGKVMNDHQGHLNRLFLGQ